VLKLHDDSDAPAFQKGTGMGIAHNGLLRPVRRTASAGYDGDISGTMSCRGRVPARARAYSGTVVPKGVAECLVNAFADENARLRFYWWVWSWP